MLTTAVAVVLAFLPGGILGFVVPFGLSRWAVFAAAPVLTLGLTSIGMAWLPVFGLPNNVGSILVAEFVLAAVAVCAGRVIDRRRAGAADGDASSSHARGGDRGPTREAPATWRRLTAPAAWREFVSPATWRRWSRREGGFTLLDVLAIAVPIAVCLSVGQLIVGGFQFPPGWDGMNHALLTRNIGASGSWTMTSVCSTGSTVAKASCQFYPLAGDVLWAQAATLSGGHISTAMNAWTAIVAPLALVIAICAAVRALGGSPVVAGCAAVASALIGPIWESMLTGRVTEEVGPALGVTAALLFALAVRGRHSLRLGALAGLGTAGLLMTHTYEVLFAATLAVALAVFRGGGWKASSVMKATAATVLGTVLAIAPYLGPILHAKGERTTGLSPSQGDLAATFKYWITDFNRYIILGYPSPGGRTVQQHVGQVQVALWLTLGCLLASPLCFVFRSLRWARPWILLFVLWTVVGMWTSYSSSKSALFVGSLWYGTRDRLRVMIFPVYGIATVAGACAIGLCGAALVTRLRRGSRESVSWASWAGRLPTATASAIVVVLVGASWAPASRGLLRQALALRAPEGPSYARTFRWLADHTDRGKVVAYDRHLEFITWSYADYGVPLLFGIPPLVTRTVDVQDYVQRFDAWNWLVNNPDAPAAGCLVRKYGIQYVVTGTDRVPGIVPDYRRSLLAKSPRLKLVHQDGGLKVYAVNARGSNCGVRT